jgi:hypothetical protein
MSDHEFTYRGPLNNCCNSQAQQPLSPDAARRVALEALATGRIRLTSHFRLRAGARKFDLLDVESVISRGQPIGIGVMCPEKKNIKYVFSGLCGDKILTVVFALDPTQSYEETPLAILITGCWKKRSQRSTGVQIPKRN